MSDLIRREDAIALMQRVIDGYGQKMRDATVKAEKRDWQSMLFAAVDIDAAIRTIPAVTVQAQIDAAVAAERERCAEVAAKMDGDYIRGKYDIQYNRKRYDAEAVGRVQFKACCILSEDISAAIRKGDQP